MSLLASQAMNKMIELDADPLIVAYPIAEEDKKCAAKGKEPIKRTKPKKKATNEPKTYYLGVGGHVNNYEKDRALIHCRKYTNCNKYS